MKQFSLIPKQSAVYGYRNVDLRFSTYSQAIFDQRGTTSLVLRTPPAQMEKTSGQFDLW
jgi:hypothetical protein